MKQWIQKTIALLLVICVLCTSIPITAKADETMKEENTAGKNVDGFIAPIDDPDASAVKITTADQLAAISNDLTGNYVLMNDIDLSEYGAWTPIGSLPDSAFRGKFDGQGHKISGLTITQNELISIHHPAGLFGCCNSAQIKVILMQEYLLAP